MLARHYGLLIEVMSVMQSIENAFKAFRLKNTLKMCRGVARPIVLPPVRAELASSPELS